MRIPEGSLHVATWMLLWQRDTRTLTSSSLGSEREKEGRKEGGAHNCDGDDDYDDDEKLGTAKDEMR